MQFVSNSINVACCCAIWDWEGLYLFFATGRLKRFRGEGRKAGWKNDESVSNIFLCLCAHLKLHLQKAPQILGVICSTNHREPIYSSSSKYLMLNSCVHDEILINDRSTSLMIAKNAKKKKLAQIIYNVRTNLYHFFSKSFKLFDIL